MGPIRFSRPVIGAHPRRVEMIVRRRRLGWVIRVGPHAHFIGVSLPRLRP